MKTGKQLLKLVIIFPKHRYAEPKNNSKFFFLKKAIFEKVKNGREKVPEHRRSSSG